MIQNAALDVAVGLALMYLMLSLLCTVINEFIASKLGLRAASLASGLEEILDDPSVRARFYDHGLIASPRNAVTNSEKVFGKLAWRLGDLRAAVVAARSAPKPAPSSPPSGTLPSSPSDSATSPPAPPPGNHSSYISSINFATALIGSLKAVPAPDKKVPGFTQIEAAVDALPETRLKSALQSTLATANDDVEKFQKSVAGWFDDSMERLSGAYKRDLQWLSIIIGLIVAILFNADSFGVAHKLWMDPNLDISHYLGMIDRYGAIFLFFRAVALRRGAVRRDQGWNFLQRRRRVPVGF